MKDVCIVSSAIGIEDIYSKVIDTQRAYCERYGFDYYLKTELNESDKRIPYPGAMDDKKSAWTKVTSCIDKLKEGYKWVVWVDCDIQIRDTAPDFRIVDDNEHSIYLTPHSNEDQRINAGTMIFLNCDASIDFLQMVLDNRYTRLPEGENIKYENGHINYYSNQFTDHIKLICYKWNSLSDNNHFNHMFGLSQYNNSDEKDIETMLKKYRFYVNLNPHLKRYKDIHKGETAYLIGNGPTVKDFYGIADSLEGIKIATNGSIYTDIKADYLMVSDPPRKVDGKKVWSKFLAEWELYERFPKVILKEYIVKESGLTNHVAETYRSNIDQFRVLRGELKHKGFNKDISKDIGSNVSIGHDMFQFILYTGVSKLFIVGCDCGESGYQEGDEKKKWLGDISLKKAKQLLDCWDIAKEWSDAEYPDVEIKVVNPVNLKLWEGVILC